MVFEEGRSGVTSGLRTGMNLEARKDRVDIRRWIATIYEPKEQVRVHRVVERLIERANGIENCPPHDRTGLRDDLAGAE